MDRKEKARAWASADSGLFRRRAERGNHAVSRKINSNPSLTEFSLIELNSVLGRPGAGCSTFLRTIAGHHSSFLGVTGSIDYSGLSPDEVSGK